MIDSVLSYHLSATDCGVARFNQQLAKRLGVPCLPVDRHPRRYPLVSIKPSEIRDGDPWAKVAEWYGTFDLFLHDVPTDRSVLRNAQRVFTGNAAITAAIRSDRPDAITGFCPNTLTGNPQRGQYRVLTFGMAHKRLAHHFSQLKHRLDQEHPDYTIEVSSAVHHGQPTNDTGSLEALRGIFGDRLRLLGLLDDDALARVLHDVDAVALYFDPALRANNTSAWAALEAGKTLYTNTDADSPPLDATAHSWDKLVEIVRG